MCNICLTYHKELFEDHQLNDVNKKSNEIFIDIYKNPGHEKRYEFFCKKQNELCCVVCISKLQCKGYGQHKDYDICLIDDIKVEKKNKLKENIKYLKDLINNLENTKNELKILFEKINKNKEELKLYIQKVFTKLRSAINEWEDELLIEIDNKFDNNFCSEDIIEESIKLPNKIKKYLEKGKLSDKDWINSNKLSSLINDCINIEKNINNIISLNDNINKSKKYDEIKIIFIPQNEQIDKFIHSIKSFGGINTILQKFYDGSIILTSKEDSNKLYDLISNKIKLSNMKLLYRASRDGNEYKNVVDKINDKSCKSRIFGNYTKVKLENLNNTKDKYYIDENVFVFSLNNNKIYKIIKPELSIRFYNQKYPILTGNNGKSNGFYFDGDTIYDEGLLINPKVYDFEKNSELTEGESKFNELEIFEIN